jgi:ubiquinone/menaquinone biosynthesis C-methylase UbiE
MDDWNQLIQQAYRCLKPGGYLEVVEMEFRTFSDDDKLVTASERTWNILQKLVKSWGDLRLQQRG